MCLGGRVHLRKDGGDRLLRQLLQGITFQSVELPVPCHSLHTTQAAMPQFSHLSVICCPSAGRDFHACLFIFFDMNSWIRCIAIFHTDTWHLFFPLGYLILISILL